MIVYIAPNPMPCCKYCGKQLDWYVPGLPMTEHAHATCEGKALAGRVMKDIKLQ